MGLKLVEPNFLFRLFSTSMLGPLPAIRESLLIDNCNFRSIHALVARLISEVDMTVEFDPAYDLTAAVTLAHRGSYPFA